MGKPIVQSREEIDQAMKVCDAMIEMAPNALKTKVISESEKSYKKIVSVPLGPVLILPTYDHPVL